MFKVDIFLIFRSNGVMKAKVALLYSFFFLFLFFIIQLFLFYFIFKLYIIVLVLPNIKMNPSLFI